MIGHTNKGMRAGWFLDSVQIVVPVHGKNYMFPSHRWLCKDEADGKTEVEIYPSEILEVEQCRWNTRTDLFHNVKINIINLQEGAFNYQKHRTDVHGFFLFVFIRVQTLQSQYRGPTLNELV